MKKIFILTSLINFIFLAHVFAANKAAKVILLRGKVFVEEDGKKSALKKGVWVNEKAQVTTSKKSFVKLLFIDKSSMNLGPKSEMVIDTFPKKKAGIVTLLKGQLRSKVTKNYMEMKNKDKSKLFIKTPTAAMGIRGTDFQVNYNPGNKNTSLITFSGAVAMAQLPDNYGRNPSSSFKSQTKLEKMVSSKTAVLVKKGQISGVMPGKTKKAMKPVKMHPGQHEAMKHNDGSKFSDEGPKEKKKMRSIVPKGMPGKDFANDSNEADKQMEKMVGSKVHKQIIEKVKEIKFKENEVYSAFENHPDANHDENKLGSEKPAQKYNGNGMMFNNEVVGFITPDQESIVDPNTGTLAPDPRLGSYDPATGAWHPTEYQMTLDGQFIPMEDSRSPASIDQPDGNEPTADTPPPVMMYNPDDLDPQFIEENQDVYRDPAHDPLFKNGTCDQLCQEAMEQRDQDIKDSTIQTNSTNRTPVTIKINAQ